MWCVCVCVCVCARVRAQRTQGYIYIYIYIRNDAISSSKKLPHKTDQYWRNFERGNSHIYVLEKSVFGKPNLKK